MHAPGLARGEGEVTTSRRMAGSGLSRVCRAMSLLWQPDMGILQRLCHSSVYGENRIRLPFVREDVSMADAHAMFRMPVHL